MIGKRQWCAACAKPHGGVLLGKRTMRGRIRGSSSRTATRRLTRLGTNLWPRPIGRARGASLFWARKKIWGARKKMASPFCPQGKIFAILGRVKLLEKNENRRKKTRVASSEIENRGAS